MDGANEIEEDPVVRARIIRLLRARPKLVELEFRDQLLRNLEQNIEDRRRPSNLSSSVSRTIERVTEPVIRDTVRDQMNKANETILRRL